MRERHHGRHSIFNDIHGAVQVYGIISFHQMGRQFVSISNSIFFPLIFICPFYYTFFMNYYNHFQSRGRQLF